MCYQNHMWSSESVAALVALTVLEIVLGIDNLLFISILADKLPKAKQGLAYRLGLIGACGTRIALLLALSWLTAMDEATTVLLGRAFSVRDAILIAGGLFLLAKSAREIYHQVEEPHAAAPVAGLRRATLSSVIVQVMLLDVVFSVDSVITAVGMAKEVSVMVTAIAVSIGVMLVFAQAIGDFIGRHPSLKILALAFLTLIGVTLIAEGFGEHLPRGYVYAALAFSVCVELLHIRAGSRVHTKKPHS